MTARHVLSVVFINHSSSTTERESIFSPTVKNVRLKKLELGNGRILKGCGRTTIGTTKNIERSVTSGVVCDKPAILD
jgi:hypothetical protein